MDLNLENKVIMILGATRGLGRACADVFAAEGCRLAIIARDENRLEKTATEISRATDVPIEIFPSDFTSPNASEDVVNLIMRRFGKIDALVNTVGAFRRNPEGNPIGADFYWDEAYQSILMAAVRSCRSVIPTMQKNGGGAIVNTSALSVRHYSPAISHYSAMKAAIAHFTKNVAIHYAKDNIRANTLLPGWIWSEQVQATYEEFAKTAEVKGKSRGEIFQIMNERAHRATYSERPGEPIEYARVAAFLCSDAASYVNGAWMNVDGGSMF